MTNYNLKPPSTFSSLDLMEKKAARKKLLEEVRKRRYQMAARRRAKEQNAYNTDEEYREYQDMIARSQ
jgi:hypothetical protein